LADILPAAPFWPNQEAFSLILGVVPRVVLGSITGTGLGLYVAKQIVEGLSGKIWAESAGKDQGSRFIVEFPRSDQPVDLAANHQIEAYLPADRPDKAGTRKDLRK